MTVCCAAMNLRLSLIDSHANTWSRDATPRARKISVVQSTQPSVPEHAVDIGTILLAFNAATHLCADAKATKSPHFRRFKMSRSIDIRWSSSCSGTKLSSLGAPCAGRVLRANLRLLKRVHEEMHQTSNHHAKIATVQEGRASARPHCSWAPQHMPISTQHKLSTIASLWRVQSSPQAPLTSFFSSLLYDLPLPFRERRACCRRI